MHDLVFGPAQDPERDIFSFLFHRNAAAGAFFLLALAAALPADGLGVSVCWFQSLTGLPCPGCGLTRSISSILHLRLTQALDYHPFGFFLVALFAMMAMRLVLPARAVERLAISVRRHSRIVRRMYLAAVYGFIVFGALRVAWSGWYGLRGF